MSYVSVNDVLEELAEENTRLTNELLVAKEEVINRRLRTGTDENNDNDCNVDFSYNKQLMAKKRLKIHNKSYKTDRKRSDLSSDQIVFGCDVCHKFKFNLRSNLKRHLGYEHNINDETDGEDKSRDQSEDHPTANGQSLQTKTIDKTFECSVCKLRFHVECQKTFKKRILTTRQSNSRRTARVMSTHLREYHKLTKVVFNREVSRSDSESDSEAEDRDVRRDYRSFECHICQKSSSLCLYLNRHLMCVNCVVIKHKIVHKSKL